MTVDAVCWEGAGAGREAGTRPQVAGQGAEGHWPGAGPVAAGGVRPAVQSQTSGQLPPEGVEAPSAAPEADLRSRGVCLAPAPTGPPPGGARSERLPGAAEGLGPSAAGRGRCRRRAGGRPTAPVQARLRLDDDDGTSRRTGPSRWSCWPARSPSPHLQYSFLKSGGRGQAVAALRPSRRGTWAATQRDCPGFLGLGGGRGPLRVGRAGRRPGLRDGVVAPGYAPLSKSTFLAGGQL